ncbi:MAG TPA: DNA repair protein RecN [Actinomycetota bacterium]|nr:DNA repair protein RecN [Actinomycetota bacterium]
MLDELHVARLGVVADATLSMAPGLNVLTGETGAGKTLITVGLALAVGGRPRQALVGSGRPALGVEARFRVRADDPAIREWVEEEGSDHELVLARTIGSDGKSSARIGGRLAPVATLASAGSRLVEIHGQNQAERLAAPGAQLEFVDRFVGAVHLEFVARYRAEFRELQRTRATLEELERGAREREREKDLLQYQINEIEAAQVGAGELAALGLEEARLAHAERIIGLVSAAEDAVGREGGAADALREAGASLQAVGSLDSGAAAMSERMGALAAEVTDALAEIRAYRESVQVDPARLELVHARLQALKTLERKYGDGEEGILAYLAEARSRLAALDQDEGARDDLAGRADALAVSVAELAGRLTAGRSTGGPALAQALKGEVEQLGMPGAVVVVEVIPLDELGPDGAERVEIRFAGGTGQPALPLAKTASGGELSRMMLACRTVLADLDDVPTLVFDEVDAGIGGRTAHAVAARLARLAASRQVVVVTHLAQIAARADRHFVVTKNGGEATVSLVEGEERVEEIARMLSGTTGEVSLAHARELMAGDEPQPERRRAKAGTGRPR